MLYENVKALAIKKGLSIPTLEAKAQLSNGAIGKWRTSSPSVENLSKVAKVLEVTVNELIQE